ncbi:TPR-like protein, partial [Rhizopogon salebrosus TDB-379]
MRRGVGHDLDEAISFQREALSVCRVGHPIRPVSLHSLAHALLTRFQDRDTNEDLDDAIVLQTQVLDLWPVDDLSRCKSLIGMANVLLARFARRGNDKDLDDAIAFDREALDSCPVDHPDRLLALITLGTDLHSCFKYRGSNKDLHEAITVYREALDLLPLDHPERSTLLGTLANAFSTRFKRRGSDGDLDEAIALYREAHGSLRVSHQGQYALSNNLAMELLFRFKHRGNDQDLDEAIALLREALVLRSGSHPDRSKSLNNLGDALCTCFSHRGNDELLEEAIALHREGMDLQPIGHRGRAWTADRIASVLLMRFHLKGNDKDLDDAISIWREELYSLPAGHHDRCNSLNNFAGALLTRYASRGNTKDIDDASTLYKEELDLRPDSNGDRSMSLIKLTRGLFIRSTLQHNDELLDKAIAHCKEALNLQSVGHRYRIVSLDTLATMLQARFEHRGNHQDLDEAIVLYKKALDCWSGSHINRPYTSNNLANVLSIRFTHRGDIHDLDEALANAHSALSLLPMQDARQSSVHDSLATIHMLFYESGLDSTGEDVDSLNTAIGHCKAGVDSVCSGLRSRLETNLLWVRYAEKYTHITLLEAYATSIQLLDNYISATASVSSRHRMMKVIPSTLAVDAASCALRHGEVCRAVELLEQGRTLIWTQMARFRMPIEGLQERGNHADTLVKKFRELSYLLDKPPAELPEETPRVRVDAEAVRYASLVDDWKKTVEEIRKLEGFSRFMLPPLFSDLQDAARDGPVIVLMVSKSSCNAIIIPRHQLPVGVRLAVSTGKLARLVITLQGIVRGGVEEAQAKLIGILRELWNDVVCPVVEHLGRFAPPGSRIWWCPTSAFNFLPLHAAGEYRQGGKNLSKLYISSYTPSLTALIRARGRHDRPQPMPFAAIGQNCPPGYPYPLPSVEPELELVRSLLPPAPTVSFTKITSVESTKSRALDTLRDNHWLHFACHGTQSLGEPFKSAFLMRDEPLTLLDIAQTDLSRHEFAFLSACETAVGSVETPDEVIHLAAALQFAGVKSVIGTFWSVDDSTVQRLVEAFYRNLCRDGKMNPKRAARALHMAVQSLANDKDIALDQRIVFMHIG